MIDVKVSEISRFKGHEGVISCAIHKADGEYGQDYEVFVVSHLGLRLYIVFLNVEPQPQIEENKKHKSEVEDASHKSNAPKHTFLSK